MTKNEFVREKLYQVTMSIARNLLDEGSITEEKYREIDTIFTAKYRPTLGQLFSDPDLIYVGSRVMNSTGKE